MVYEAENTLKCKDFREEGQTGTGRRERDGQIAPPSSQIVLNRDLGQIHSRHIFIANSARLCPGSGVPLLSGAAQGAGALSAEVNECNGLP
jgi:hypothetical protein